MAACEGEKGSTARVALQFVVKEYTYESAAPAPVRIVSFGIAGINHHPIAKIVVHGVVEDDCPDDGIPGGLYLLFGDGGRPHLSAEPGHVVAAHVISNDCYICLHRHVDAAPGQIQRSHCQTGIGHFLGRRQYPGNDQQPVVWPEGWVVRILRVRHAVSAHRHHRWPCEAPTIYGNPYDIVIDEVVAFHGARRIARVESGKAMIDEVFTHDKI